MDAAAAYEQHAPGFLRARDKSNIGARVVEQWSRQLNPGTEVIDIACGAGYPVTKVLVHAGLSVWAIDASPTLLAQFRARFPRVRVACERAQQSHYFGRKFGAAISVGLLFLLPESDQVNLIRRMSEIMVTGGSLLFTAPLEVGTWIDLHTGHECRSLGRARYEDVLERSGLRLIATHEDEGANNYYEAQKIV